jgi:glycosyltransferase involved in cell wall biosynthesis
MATLTSAAGQGRTVAIVPWGDVIEDWLGPLGLDLHDLVGRMSGGWLFGYAAALRAAGWRPIVVCASEAVDRPTRFEHQESGAPIWALPGRRSGSGRTRNSESLRCLAQWVRTPRRGFREVFARERCAAIIVQEYEYSRFDVLARLARRMRIPLCATFQGGDVTLSVLERMIRPSSLSACQGLIVPSARERLRLTQAYPGLSLRIAPIPNPLDVEAWRASPRDEARAQLGLPPDALIFLNHGRIDIRRKGLDLMLEAWLRFAGVRPDAWLTLIGSGQDHDAFAALLAERRLPRVTWLSDYVVDPPLIRRWMSAADAYVAVSRLEGMPVAPLEAMACGLPVICSDAHGLDDIFQGGEEAGGLVTPMEDVRAIFAAMRRLAEDPGLRARLGAAARRRVERDFSLEAVGAALGNFIDVRR